AASMPSSPRSSRAACTPSPSPSSRPANGRSGRRPSSRPSARAVRRAERVVTLGVVTDLHFGPEAHFGGKLRKLTAAAPALARAFAEKMRATQPDLVINLGDDIEDESPERDAERYAACLAIL